MKLRKSGRLIFGVGLNDANYSVTRHEEVDGKRKIVWKCPYYIKWVSMLGRCYHLPILEKNPSYVGCSAVPEWHLFSNFKSWMETQDWEGKELDKDILSPNNKVYGPDFCIFVDKRTNVFVTERARARGKYPIGVTLNSWSGRFNSECCSVVTGKTKFLGVFDTPEEAHRAWLSFKLEQAYILASEQTDSRVAKALIERYEKYIQS